MADYKCSQCFMVLSGPWMYCSNRCKQVRDGRKTLQSATERYSPSTLPGAVNQRYGHTTLPRYRPCQQCQQMHKRNSQYCSNACKQTAYRRRKDADSGSWARRRERAQRAVSTKQWATRQTVCAHCGQERRFTVAQSTNRMYCSDRCKQAAYRARKEKS